MHRDHWPRLNFVLLAFVLFLALSPLTSVLAAESPAVHGISPADMDLTVDPAVDFYEFANGGWLERTTIPADVAGIEPLAEIHLETRDQLLALLTEQSANSDIRPGSDEWKAIRLYEQGIDLETRNALGIDPIQPVLDQIDAIDDLEAMHEFLEGSFFQNVSGMFEVRPGPDLYDSTRMVAYLRPTALGLPGYIEDATTQPLIDAYVETVATQLVLLGGDESEAQAAARAVYELEAMLWLPLLRLDEVQDDIGASYNPITIEQLGKTYPLMDWPAYFAGLGLGDVTEFVVTEPRYFNVLEQRMTDTPLPVLKDFLRLQLLRYSSGLLSEELDTIEFEFYGRILSGTEQPEAIEYQSLNRVNNYLPDALGQLYVEAYFSPEARAESQELTEEIIAAFRARLERNPWMTAETKAAALAKLDTLQVKVGYPDTWRDYASVTIADSYYDSVISSWNAWYRDQVAKIGAPVDKTEWAITPQTANAVYLAANNEIVLPAAILQPPFFDPQADPASNFGAIGFIVGHEITHGFDLQGAQFDGEGNLSNWWSEADEQQFQARNDKLAAQYSAIEVLPGHFIDGQLTVTENAADLGGIQVAYDALQLHLERHGRPDLADGSLSQEQRFFIAAASVWRSEIREEMLKLLLTADPHAPSAVRAIQPLRNCDAFYEAFDIDPDDPMYLPPDERIVIW